MHPSLSKAYLPHIRSKITAAHGNGSIFPYVAAVTTTRDDTSRRLRIPMDSFRGARVVANPWEVALSPDGARAYVVFGGTNDMYVANIVDDDYQELTYAATVQARKQFASSSECPATAILFTFTMRWTLRLSNMTLSR